MRWGFVVVSLGLAGCLAAPPSSTADTPPDGEDGAPPDLPLVLGGLAARDALTLDMRDELVLIGHREGAPVAVVLFPGVEGFEDVTVTPVDLPLEPVDLTVAQWGSLTGLAILLGQDGSLLALDQDVARVPLELTDEGEPATPLFRQLAELNAGGRRLVLADDEDLYVTVPLGTGLPGEQALEIIRLEGASEPLVVAGASVSASLAAIGVIESNHEIDVYQITENTEPTVSLDRVVDVFAPAALERARWLMNDTTMVLLGIDPDVPRLWFQSVPIGGGESETGSARDGEVDAIHDVVVTRLDPAVADLILLTESAGALQVEVYLDPEASPDVLPTGLTFPLDGLSPPVWLEAMDAVLDGSPVGQNEIIVYDQTGRLSCIDLAIDRLESCGTLDLAPELSSSGASISGRPGW